MGPDIANIIEVFEKGYELGKSDSKEGIYISRVAYKEYFLSQLELILKKTPLKKN
ncbi:MAG: hypothetical protein HRT37_23815 [Alteromonadaceae bacterium]|nr:hypothetical protein [Alteromonadaceae bacterium]